MKITVVYALPRQQIVRELELPEDSTVSAALEQSGLLEDFPAIDPKLTKLGIFGKTASRDDVLQPGDRVEIYRPLKSEPKAARRLRSKKR